MFMYPVYFLFYFDSYQKFSFPFRDLRYLSSLEFQSQYSKTRRYTTEPPTHTSGPTESGRLDRDPELGVRLGPLRNPNGLRSSILTLGTCPETLSDEDVTIPLSLSAWCRFPSVSSNLLEL